VLDLDPDFTIRTALALARLCRAAYLDQPGEDINALGLTSHTTFLHRGDVNGLVVTAPTRVMLAFRGTAALQSWLTDARVVQVAAPSYPGQVHRGFAGALDATWGDVRRLLPPAGDGRPLWVTGHDLGAALATLAGARLTAEGAAVSTVYTFGSPRVGDRAFYEGYRPRAYRLVNNNDVVPHLPLEFLATPPGDSQLPTGFRFSFLTYKHVGTLKYFDRHGRLGEGMSDWSAKKSYLQAALAQAGQLGPQMVADHAIDSYIRVLAANLPPPP